MKRTFTRIPALVLGAAMLLSLCSCGGKGMSTEDASKCVQVEMDATYKGEFQGFVDFYDNVTMEDARNQYNDNVEGEAYYFLYSFGPEAIDGSGDTVDPTDMQLHRAKELYENIYATGIWRSTDWEGNENKPAEEKLGTLLKAYAEYHKVMRFDS